MNAEFDKIGSDQFRDDENVPYGYDEDAPSFGQRLGMKAPVQQAPEAAQAKNQSIQPPGASTAPPAIQLDPQKLPPGILKNNPTPSEIPSPAASSPATTTLPGLMADRASAAAPIDPRAVDSSTGKPKYRMGLGQRILGTVANAAMGFGGRGGDPVYVGPGATNNRFARDVDMQGKKVAALDTDIGNQEKLAGLQQKGYEDALKQAYEGQLGEARERTAGAAEDRAKAYGELADTKAQLVDSQNQLNQSRANKLDTPAEPKTEAEIAIAYQNALLKGDKQGATKFKGAMDMLARQKAAGKDTSVADLAKTLQVAEYRRNKLGDLDKQRDEEEQKATAALAKDFIGGGAVPGPKRDAALAKIKSEMDAKFAPRVQAVQDEADQMLGLTKAGQKMQNGTRNDRVTVIDKATGKSGTIPRSQLALALKSGKYRQ